MFAQINTMLGGSSIEIHLEADDFDVAFDEALHQYRANSQNSVKFGWVFLSLEPGKQIYQLPEWVRGVREVYRQRAGLSTNMLEPFSYAFIQNMMGQTASANGDLVMYEVVAQYQELVARMFGGFIPYTYDRMRKQIYINSYPRTVESIGLEVSATRSIDDLLNHSTSFRWLRSYTEAVLRGILGEKYSRFGSLPGAQGATTLNGTQLIADAKEMKKDLLEQLFENQDGNEPAMPAIM